MKVNLTVTIIGLCTQFSLWAQTDTLFVTFNNVQTEDIGFLSQSVTYRPMHSFENFSNNKEVRYRYEFNRILPDSTEGIESEIIATVAYLYKQVFWLSYLTELCDNSKTGFINDLKQLSDNPKYSRFRLFETIEADSINMLRKEDIYQKVLKEFKALDTTESWRDGSKTLWAKMLRFLYYSNFKTYNRILKDSTIYSDNRFINLNRKFTSREEYLETYERLRNAEVIYLSNLEPLGSTILFQEVYFIATSKKRY